MSMSATLQDCLRSKGSQYEIVHHPYSHSSGESAAAAHIPGDRLAKTVLLEDEHGYVAAVLPSTYAVRLSELWAQTGRHLILAKSPICESCSRIAMRAHFRRYVRPMECKPISMRASPCSRTSISRLGIMKS